MGTGQGMQSEVGFYHTSDSCVTIENYGLHGSQSRFPFDFGRITTSQKNISGLHKKFVA